jgi:hypothetical protein
LEVPLGGSRGPGSASGVLVAAKVVKCPKSYYTEHFEKYGYIRDKYDTTYNTPTPYDPSLIYTYIYIYIYIYVHEQAMYVCGVDTGLHGCTVFGQEIL